MPQHTRFPCLPGGTVSAPTEALVAAPPPPPFSLQENSDAILLKAAVTILAECEGDLLVQEVRPAFVCAAGRLWWLCC